MHVALFSSHEEILVKTPPTNLIMVVVLEAVAVVHNADEINVEPKNDVASLTDGHINSYMDCLSARLLELSLDLHFQSCSLDPETHGPPLP